MTNPNWNKAERDRRMAFKRTQSPKLHARPDLLRAEALYKRALKLRLRCLECEGAPARGQIAKMGVNERGPWMICVACVGTS